MNYIEEFLKHAKYKAIAEIDYNDLDRLITDFFKEHVEPTLDYYEIVAYEELGNYQKTSFDIAKTPKYDWQHQEVDQIIETIKLTKEWPNFKTADLLHYMCKADALPECELIVDISW